MPESGMKTKCLFLINHDITVGKEPLSPSFYCNRFSDEMREADRWWEG